MTAKLLLASALVLAIANPITVGRAQDRMGPSVSHGACRAPVKYRIGRVDPRFGITRGDFQRYIADAAKVWETAAGRTLFSPDDKGGLEINLVYDSRQETTQRLTAVRAGISEKLEEADRVKARMLPLQDNLRTLHESYAGELSSYNRRQDDYNKVVAHWNEIGGAPDGAYQDLNSQRLALRQQAASLKASKQELDRLIDDINQLVERHNALLRRANAEANALSDSGSFGVEFEEGHYMRQGGEERIDIFQFDGEVALRIILSHELGHALGIRHNGDAASIMSPLIHTKMLALTEGDIEGLKTACSLR